MTVPSESMIQSPSTCLGAVLPFCLRYKGSDWNVENPTSWESLVGVPLATDSAQAVQHAIEDKMRCFLAKENGVFDVGAANGNASDCEIPLDLPEGRFWVRICGEIQCKVDREVVFQGHVQEITSFKMREEGLKARLAEQQKLNAVKTNFINYAVHEFKGPLATIFSSLDLLNYYASLYEEGNGELPYFSEHFRKITKHLQLMNAFLDEMVLLSGGGEGCKQEEFLLGAFIQQFVQRLELPSMKTRQISLELPNSDHRVQMDKLLLEHVLRNLISNAFKYSPGERDPELVVRLGERSFTVLVRDYGLGIPEKEQHILFQSPYRGSNAKEKRIAGTGMGLLIVKDFMERLGGEISFSSREGKGTTFELHLPLKQPKAALSKE